MALIVSTAVFLIGAAVSRGADYQDFRGNVCEGTFSSSGCATWGSHVTGFNNTAMGDAMMPMLNAGNGNVGLDTGALASVTFGDGNIALGNDALNSDTSGSNNIATGGGALQLNSTGSRNIAAGLGSLNSNSTGHDNIATGVDAMFRNSIGSDDVASGFDALQANTTGTSNVAIGHNALSSNTTGSGNTVIGRGAGRNLTTGANNIDVANGGAAGESGRIRIGTNGQQTAAFLAGVNGVTIPGPTREVVINGSGQLGTAPATGAVSSPPAAGPSTRQLQDQVNKLEAEVAQLRALVRQRH
jgi:trimeric autotransporter adhesin